MTLELLQATFANYHRVRIAPRVKVEAKAPEQKREIVEIARRVIARHEDVLRALKDR